MCESLREAYADANTSYQNAVRTHRAGVIGAYVAVVANPRAQSLGNKGGVTTALSYFAVRATTKRQRRENRQAVRDANTALTTARDKYRDCQTQHDSYHIDAPDSEFTTT